MVYTLFIFCYIKIMKTGELMEDVIEPMITETEWAEFLKEFNLKNDETPEDNESDGVEDFFNRLSNW